MKNKFITLLLCGALAFSCACNSGNESSNGQSAGDSSQSANNQLIEQLLSDGYIKEVGNNMFWEKEDVVNLQDGYVTQDTSIRIYNYAPSILQEDENTRYVYYCSNRYSSNTLKEFEYLGVSPNQQGKYWDYVDEVGKNRITDYVAFRKGIRVGTDWYWSEKSYVLAPTIGSMTEGEQTCDPNVIKGEFKYNGTTYSYLMSYLACATRDNTYNHVCVAVANKPEGPWIKCDDINPLVEYTSEGLPESMLKTYLWGYGQPSMFSIDKKGKVLMFYSSICPYKNETSGAWGHATNTTVARYDLSNLNDVKIDYTKRGISYYGIKVPSGDDIDCLVNGDFAYDPMNKRIYIMTDKGTLNYVVDKSLDANAQIGDLFRDYPTDWKYKGIKWVTIGAAVPQNIKYYTNAHNACVIRDSYGWVYNPDNVEVAITGSLSENNYKRVFTTADSHIWTFRIMRYAFDIV